LGSVERSSAPAHSSAHALNVVMPRHFALCTTAVLVACGLFAIASTQDVSKPLTPVTQERNIYTMKPEVILA
jgi:hypothetical protein